MFNIILSICTSVYWFKHCNVSRNTSFMKAFCRLRKLSIYVFSYFPFVFEGRIWDLIVSVLIIAYLFTFLTHQSVNYFFAMNDYDAIQSHARKFHIGGFLFVRYDHKASWDFLAAYSWLCWLLISFPLHHLICIALSSPWLGKRGLVYQWACK